MAEKQNGGKDESSKYSEDESSDKGTSLSHISTNTGSNPPVCLTSNSENTSSNGGPINQSIDQSASESINQSSNTSLVQSTNLNPSGDQAANQSINQPGDNLSISQTDTQDKLLSNTLKSEEKVTEKDSKLQHDDCETSSVSNSELSRTEKLSSASEEDLKNGHSSSCADCDIGPSEAEWKKSLEEKNVTDNIANVRDNGAADGIEVSSVVVNVEDQGQGQDLEAEVVGEGGGEGEERGGGEAEPMEEKEEKSGEEIDAELKDLKDTWRPLHELRQRELGRACRCTDTERLSRSAGASVELARRLILHRKLDEHEGCVNALHFNDDGSLLASGSDDLRVIVWDWINSRSRFSFNTGHNSNVFQCKFMPHMNDTHMVTCARDGQIRLAVLSNAGLNGRTRRIAEHRGSAHKISVKQDSSHCLYTCGEDAVVFHIDLREDKPNKLCTVKEGTKRIELYSVHSNPFNSHEFCVGGRDQYVRIYDSRKISETGGILKKFCPQHMLDLSDSRIKANVTCAVYNHDGTELLGTYNDDDVYLFENKSTDCNVWRYTGHRNNATVKGVNFYGPRSEFIVSGSDCGHVFVWDKKTQRIINCFYADDGGVVNVLEPHPSAPILATSGLDSDVKIWMPLANEPVLMNGLEKLIKKNRREREMEREESPDHDSQMLWLLMQHLRRSARRQMRIQRAERNAAGGINDDDDDDVDDDTTSDDNDDDDDDDDDETSSPAQCRAS